MKLQPKLPILLMAALPLAARAGTEGAPNLEYLIVGGSAAAGGFLGALLACWLCKRMGSKKDKEPDR